MRKKAIRVTTVVLFLVVFCVLFSKVSEILRRKAGGAIDRVHSLYEMRENSTDVLVLGSSHAYYGFSPNELWGNYGITSYVLGSPAQTTAVSYYLLKEFLQHQTPKAVLLESYSFKYDGLYSSEGNLRRAIDGIPFSEIKVEMLDDLLPEADLTEKMSYYIPFLKYHSRWQELQNSDFRQTRTFLHGSVYNTGVTPYEEPGMDVEPRELPEVPLEYFEKLSDLCREYGTELIVFAVPMAFDKQADYELAQGLNLSLETYLKEKGIPFLFFQKDNEIGFDYASDIQANAHANLSGQTKTTLGVGKYLVEQYQLTDHREDPAYSKWARDYQKYLKLKGDETQEVSSDDQD